MCYRIWQHFWLLRNMISLWCYILLLKFQSLIPTVYIPAESCIDCYDRLQVRTAKDLVVSLVPGSAPPRHFYYCMLAKVVSCKGERLVQSYFLVLSVVMATPNVTIVSPASLWGAARFLYSKVYYYSKLCFCGPHKSSFTLKNVLQCVCGHTRQMACISANQASKLKRTCPDLMRFH